MWHFRAQISGAADPVRRLPNARGRRIALTRSAGPKLRGKAAGCLTVGLKPATIQLKTLRFCKFPSVRFAWMTEMPTKGYLGHRQGTKSSEKTRQVTLRGIDGQPPPPFPLNERKSGKRLLS